MTMGTQKSRVLKDHLKVPEVLEQETETETETSQNSAGDVENETKENLAPADFSTPMSSKTNKFLV